MSLIDAAGWDELCPPEKPKKKVPPQKKSELLPCPFCGGEAEVEQIPSAIWDKFVAHCKSSKCIAFYIGYCVEGIYETRTKAIEAWNTRTPKERGGAE